MIKKTLIFGLSFFGLTTITLGVIASGYVINKEKNVYNQFTKVPVSASTIDLINSYFASAVSGSKLLYLTSFAHTTPLNVALNITKEYSEPIYNFLSKTGYLLIDDQYGLPQLDQDGNFASGDQPIWSTNVASAIFRADIGSFITGIAIGQFLNENKDYFLKNDHDTFKWATYGGMSFPTVTSFMGGFQKGIEWFNNNIVPNTPGFIKLEQVFANNNFVNSFELTGGNALIDWFLNQNVNVLIPIAGQQTQQAARLIKQRDNIRTIVVGVDSAIEEDPSANLPLSHLTVDKSVGNNQIIQFSSIKDVGRVTYLITDNINKGIQVGDNNLGGIGYSSLGDESNGCVGVSSSGKKYFIDAINNFRRLNRINDYPSNYENLDLEEKYNLAIKTISELQEFKNLDNFDEKVFVVKDKNGKVVESYGYGSLPNKGQLMTPIYDITKLDQWYDEIYSLEQYNSEDYQKFVKNKFKNLELIKKWIDKNQETIEFRKDNFDLTNSLTKEAFEYNHSITRIVFQSPTSVLFDKSFFESCYIGMRKYWIDYQKVNKNLIPLPPK